ncbi:MAG TPA: DUF1080 domain-containing protein [Bryobacteraceae bacterium]|jgi:hypothetical protein|nr:DUF1080 domain-containing protein [Bryobacteraceae bacterium]
MRLITVLLLVGSAGLFSAEPGFQPLFNGKDLSGWTLLGGKGSGYGVHDGAIVCERNGGGNLLTNAEYSDFILRFEFRTEPGGNNGVGIRAPLSAKDIAYQGMEIQILDHGHKKYEGWLQPWQRHGSIYNVVAAKPAPLKPAGQWNEQEIIADKRHIVVKVNGETVVDANLDDVKDPEILKKHPGILRPSGHIGFLGHGDEVAFRNIRIKPLNQ